MKLFSKKKRSALINSVLVGLSLLFLFLLFQIPLEAIFSALLVTPLLKHVNSIWYNDIGFLFFTVLIFWFIIKGFKKHEPEVQMVIFFWAITILYLFYRFTSNVWEFTSLSITDKIKYADLLLLPAVPFTFRFFGKRKEAIKTSIENELFDDTPLGESGEDFLGYTKYAETIVEKIKKCQFDKSFAIGVNGRWGVGKTSFIDLIKRGLNSNEFVQVNFNPWASSSANSIINDFFEAVQENIPSQSLSLNRLLSKYAQKIGSDHSIKLFQVSQIITGFWSNSSTEQLFQKINAALQKAGKKLVVFIDDVDRLDKDEILEVVKLIRNTANFYNTFFIVAYDRDFLVNALKEHNSHNQENFLEKIFQLEINLPYFDKEILRKQLAQKLKIKLPESLHKTIDDDIIGTPMIKPEYLNDWLENIRDVTRLTNSVLLNYWSLVGEVLFNDYLRIELLRLKCPHVYELLQRRRSEFLTERTSSQGESLYELRYKDRNEPLSGPFPRKEEISCLEEHLTVIKPNYGSNSMVEKIVDFVEGIFPSDKFSRLYQRNHLSITQPSRIDLYFSYSFINSKLSEVEFTTARSSDLDEFKEKIKDWVEKGLEWDVRSRFEKIDWYDSRKDFEKVISAIFFLASLPGKNSTYPKNLVYYGGEDILRKIAGERKKLISSFYPKQDEFFEFIKNIFLNAKFPFTFESAFLRFIDKKYDNNFPLDPKEKEELSIFYLEEYCKKALVFDETMRELYDSCYQTIFDIKEGRIHESGFIPEKAKTILKIFISTKDLDGFLKSTIELNPRKKSEFGISTFPYFLWGDWEKYEAFLNSMKESDSKYLEEYLCFFKEHKSTDFKLFFEFEFKTIPIN